MRNLFKNIELKEILIPFISALLAVGINQIFVFNKKNTEALVEYEQHRLKEQVPLLNRLLLMSGKNTEGIEIKQRTTKSVEGSIISIDSLSFSAPMSFVDSTEYYSYKNHIVYLQENGFLLDHKLRLLVEFAIKIFPKNYESEAEYYLNNKDYKITEKLWYSVNKKIYNLSYEILYHEKFDGIYPTLNENNILKTKNFIEKFFVEDK